MAMIIVQKTENLARHKRLFFHFTVTKNRNKKHSNGPETFSFVFLSLVEPTLTQLNLYDMIRLCTLFMASQYLNKYFS